MKKRSKKFMSIILSLILLFSLVTTASAATVKLQWWTLVDTGGHLDWRDDGTKYINNWIAGVSMWNSYTPGVIRRDTSSTVNDVVLSDVNEVNSTNATTTWHTGLVEGTVKFNIYQMDSKTNSQRTAIAAHECGHCLGLDHNTSADIMYEYTPLVTALSENDKASYDASWAAFLRVKPTNLLDEEEYSTQPDEYVTYYNGIPVYFSESSYCINVKNYEELAGHADYVFAGEVVSNLGEVYKNEVMLETGSGLAGWSEPYTNYKIQVSENLKGSLTTDIEIQQYGGLDQSGDFYTIPSGSIILEEGQTYIFFAYAQEDGTLLVRGENSTIAYSAEEMVEIKNAVKNQTVFDRVRFTSEYAD